MRSGDPANVTRTPRALSASATASDGSTWPPVPPAAIRHTSSRFPCVTPRDVKEDPDRGEHDDEARAAVRDERQRDPGQRRDADDGGEVERGLAAHEDGQAGGERLAERVARGERDAEAGV